MPEIVEKASIAELRRRPEISWGAVFGGFFFVIAMGWLLVLLGSALGASILDATDAGAMGSGLGLGAILWTLVSALVSYFLGALLTARLAARPEAWAGMLHGVTLWSFASVALLVLGFFGVGGALETGQAVIRGTASATASIASTAVDGAQSLRDAAAAASDSELVNEVQARLKRWASRSVASLDAPGGAQVSASEVRQAAREIDRDTLNDAAIALVKGNPNGAKEIIARDTTLSEGEVSALVEGLSSQVAAMSEQLRDETRVVERARQEIDRQVTAFYNSASRTAGPSVSSTELRTAVSELDRETLREAAFELVAGRPESAKNVLAANTSLDEAQIEAVVDGVDQEVEERIQEFRGEAERVMETASDYGQAVLWTAFIAGALGLCAAIFGGMLGAGSVERLYAVNVSREVR